MTDDNFDDLYNLNDDQEELTFEELNIDKVKEKIPTHSSTKLCEMIVCDRYFGCYAEVAVACMEELAKRRTAGDNFDFESYIEKSYNELPKLEINLPNLADVMRSLVGKKFIP